MTIEVQEATARHDRQQDVLKALRTRFREA